MKVSKNKVAFRSKYLLKYNSFCEVSHLYEAYSIVSVTSEQYYICGIMQCETLLTILLGKHKTRHCF